MKVKLKGIRSHGKIQLSGITKLISKVPPYFFIEIDTDKIEARELK